MTDDRVCDVCNGILRVYPSPGRSLLHVRVNGVFYISDHRPIPRESYESGDSGS